MSQEIHITVPKGAKVVIHEQEDDETELTVEERMDALEKAVEELVAIPAHFYLPLPYVVPPAYVPPQPIPVSPPLPEWYVNHPYRITYTSSGTNANGNIIYNH